MSKISDSMKIEPDAVQPLLGQWRRRNIGRLLNNAIDRFEGRVFELLAESGHSEMRITHVSLTRNLDTGGTRLTELARRAAMTKQSMAQLVNELEGLGMVARRPDPNDRRARVIAFTPKGLAWLEAFRDALHQAEREMQNTIGADNFSTLMRCLAAYGIAGSELSD